VVGPRPLNHRLRSTAFGVRDFRYLWLAQVFRGLVVWMQSLTLPWLMLEAGGTPLDIGAAGAIQFLPSAVLSPVVGAAVGASDKRRLLLATQTMTAITTVFLLVATSAGPPRWAVYAAALALGLVGAVDNPVRHALVGQLVPDRLVTSAVSLNATIFGVTRVIGPSIAGGLIVTVGIPFTLASTAAASLAGVLLLSRLRPDRNALPAEVSPRLRHALRDGLAYVGSGQSRRLILGSLGVSVTVVGAVQAVLPVLAIAMSRADWSESGAAFLGLMFTVIGVGALVGSLAFGLVPTAPSLRVSMTASVLLSLAVVVASLVEARILFLATLGAYGFLGSVAVTLLNGHLQRATNDAFRARVMSLFVAVYAIATAVGSLVGGIAADLLPAHAALTFIGTAGAGVGLLLVLRARTRGTAEGLVPTS
jgi:MFS family permease